MGFEQLRQPTQKSRAAGVLAHALGTTPQSNLSLRLSSGKGGIRTLRSSRAGAEVRLRDSLGARQQLLLICPVFSRMWSERLRGARFRSGHLLAARSMA